MIYIIILFALNMFIDSLLDRGLHATGSKKSEIMRVKLWSRHCPSSYNSGRHAQITRIRNTQSLQHSGKTMRLEIGIILAIAATSCVTMNLIQRFCVTEFCVTLFPIIPTQNEVLYEVIPVGSKYFGLHVCCLLNHVQLFVTPWMHGSFVHGIFQARILEWVAISYSRGSSQPRDRTQVSP